MPSYTPAQVAEFKAYNSKHYHYKPNSGRYMLAMTNYFASKGVNMSQTWSDSGIKHMEKSGKTFHPYGKGFR